MALEQDLQRLENEANALSEQIRDLEGQYRSAAQEYNQHLNAADQLKSTAKSCLLCQRFLQLHLNAADQLKSTAGAISGKIQQAHAAMEQKMQQHSQAKQQIRQKSTL